jgi:hypothetical protein
MGDILIMTANYVVGSQDIDVKDYVLTEQSTNYGAIDFPVQKMDDDLRKDHRISVAKDADALKLTPPRLTITYTDAAEAYHTVDYAITESVNLGERTAFGKFVQKPGDVLWSVGLTAAKGQFLFVFVVAWALIVLWSYKQWAFLQGSYNAGKISIIIDDDYGILGKYIVLGIYIMFYYGEMVEEPLSKFFKPPVEPGWTFKFIFAFLAALTPVSSFFFQFLIWFTVVKTLMTK